MGRRNRIRASPTAPETESDQPIHRMAPRYRHRVPGRRPENVREPRTRQDVSRIGAATSARDDPSRLFAPDAARSPQVFNDTATASANHWSVPPRRPTPRVLRPIRDPWLSTLWNQRFASLQVGSRHFLSRSVPRMTLIVHPLGMERLFIGDRGSKCSKSRFRHSVNWLTATS